MLLNCDFPPSSRGPRTSASHPEGAFPTLSPAFPRGHGVAVSAFRPAQTGEIVALKKVALRRLEDGIPNQALREIKALQEIEDNQYVSEVGGRAPPPSLCSLPLGGPAPTLLAHVLPRPHFRSCSRIHSHLPNYFIPHSFTFLFIHFFLYSSIHPRTYALFLRTDQWFLVVMITATY